MKRHKELLKGSLICAGMLLCILDSKCAISGAKEGIDLCIRTVVPSLFPFILLSALFTATVMGYEWKVLTPVCRLCRISSSSIPLLITGFLGGYPVGARCVAQAYHTGSLTSSDAKRMLPFCNNCGPAFIFGMVGALFEQWWASWALWGIHITGAFIVAVLLPGKNQDTRQIPAAKPMTFVEAMEQTVRVMAGICGWVIIFRVAIEYLLRWVLPRLPIVIQVMVCGLTELSNGCIALGAIDNTGLRFLLCSVLIGFGGICVLMQTISITAEIDRSYYFPGKVIQCCVSFLLAYLLQIVAFPRQQRITLPLMIPTIVLAILFLFVFLMRKKQNSSRILQPIGV